MARLGILLIMAALIAGVVGCVQPEPELECTPMVAVGDNYYGQCNITGWTDIVQVAAGYHHTVGVKSDGTAVAAGIEVEVARWDLF